MPIWQSLRAFVGDPVGKVLAAVSFFTGVIGFAEAAAASGKAWMWMFFAALALVVLCFWRFHKEHQASLDLAVL